MREEPLDHSRTLQTIFRNALRGTVEDIADKLCLCARQDLENLIAGEATDTKRGAAQDTGASSRAVDKLRSADNASMSSGIHTAGIDNSQAALATARPHLVSQLPVHRVPSCHSSGIDSVDINHIEVSVATMDVHDVVKSSPMQHAWRDSSDDTTNMPESIWAGVLPDHSDAHIVRRAGSGGSMGHLHRQCSTIRKSFINAEDWTPFSGKITTDDDSDQGVVPTWQGQAYHGFKGKRLSLINVGGTRFFGNDARKYATRITRSPAFNYFIGVALIASAVVIGVQTNWNAEHPRSPEPISFRILEWVFCAIFICELGVRIYAYRSRFFNMPGWRWNVFDSIIVGLQVAENIMSVFEQVLGLSATRVLRLVRVLRVFRVLRMVHIVSDLRTMASAIGGAMQPFFQTLALLGIFIFIVSVYFLQIILDSTTAEHFERDTTLQTYWANVPTTLLSLFKAVTGGVDWDIMIGPLSRVSPAMVPLFVTYIAFASFVMLSLITGVFFDLTFTTIRETKERELVHQLRALFIQTDSDQSGKISFEEFQDQLTSPLFTAFFKVIDLDPSEARGLFDILDTDGDDAVEATDFVMGCLRLRGPAKAVDLATFMREANIIFDQLQGSVQEIESKLDALGGEIMPAARKRSAMFLEGSSGLLQDARPSKG